MKKVMTMLMALTMILGLTACGNGNQNRDPADVTLTVWVSGAGTQVDALKAAVDQFAAETGYTIEFSAPGETYEELMKTKMAANDMPDVFDTHGWSVARYSDFLQPVNDMDFAKNIDSQIKSAISDADGKMYVLPMDMDITGIVYNVTVLE